MIRYEYKVLPAPNKGRKAAGVKTPEGRFAHGLEQLMNEQGAEGWDYVRSDILPSEERQGLTSSHTVYRSVLVFRRLLNDAVPEVIAAPVVKEPVLQAPPDPEPEPVQTPETQAEEQIAPAPANDHARTD